MEYDNDRLIKGTSKLEIFAWILLVLLNPIANSLGIFMGDWLLWPALFLTSVFVFPLYFLYARVIVPKFLFTKRYTLFILLSIALFWVIHGLVFVLYEATDAILGDESRSYFDYSLWTFIRESAWIIINGCLAIGIAFIKAKLDEEDIVRDLQKENRFYKVRYFRTQMNPHFLFNTLNSIYSLSLNKSDKTPEVVVRLSDIMRYLLYECNEERILLKKEIEFIRNYIEIEKIRYDADIKFTVEGETDGIMIEPFLFISFIENGFKHAIDNSFAKAFIYITLKVTPEQIALNVINNTSIDLETTAKRISGRSLQKSKSVLELLYPDSYALDIIQTEKEERKESKMRMKNAQERLENLYPDAHTLDIILSNNTFTVSLILKPSLIDKMHYSRG